MTIDPSERPIVTATVVLTVVYLSDFGRKPPKHYTHSSANFSQSVLDAALDGEVNLLDPAEIYEWLAEDLPDFGDLS